ncbi:MAG TPA: cation transporter, partial [Opitutae bacterium]|nr:cation transporter [Opitutae bacterium]
MILATLDITFLASITISAFYWDDPREQNALHGWMLSMGITSMLMACLFFIGKKGRNRILRKEALCSIGLGWVLASLTGALPYLLIVENCSLSNAIFESTSGLTTTGASVFADIESFPRSLLFWRCMSQWIGGLGVVVFFVAILSFLG